MFEQIISKLYFWADYFLLSAFLYFVTMHKKDTHGTKSAPFDTVLGVTDGGCEVYSCNYEDMDRKKFPTRESMQMTYKGMINQCVAV